MDNQNPNQQQQQQNNDRRRPLGAAVTVPVAGAAAAQNQHPAAQPCPRCHSNNTKFCYYNNYSLSQPRFFCKGCRRYWTQGGTLRNVPVGGGCRKSKRPKLSPAAAASSSGSQQPPPPPQQNDHLHNNNNPLMGAGIESSTGNSPFYGSGFLSSLAAMQAVSQPLSFGPNLGLLHGLGLPGFQPQPQQNVNQQEPSFQQLLQQRHSSHDLYPGTGTASSSANWNLGNNLNNNNNNGGNNNNNGSNNQNDDHEWPDFPAAGRGGLDDP